MGLNNINSKSTWGQAASDINTNFTTIDSDLKKVKNATTRNKGYFSSIDELKAAFSTANVGDIAYVGSAYPYAIWKWNGSAWANSGSTGGEESVNLGDYYTKVETDEKFTETDEKLSELGSKIDKNWIIDKSYYNSQGVLFDLSGNINANNFGHTSFVVENDCMIVCNVYSYAEATYCHRKRGGLIVESSSSSSFSFCCNQGDEILLSNDFTKLSSPTITIYTHNNIEGQSVDVVWSEQKQWYDDRGNVVSATNDRTDNFKTSTFEVGGNKVITIISSNIENTTYTIIKDKSTGVNLYVSSSNYISYVTNSSVEVLVTNNFSMNERPVVKVRDVSVGDIYPNIADIGGGGSMYIPKVAARMGNLVRSTCIKKEFNLSGFNCDYIYEYTSTNTGVGSSYAIPATWLYHSKKGVISLLIKYTTYERVTIEAAGLKNGGIVVIDRNIYLSTAINDRSVRATTYLKTRIEKIYDSSYALIYAEYNFESEDIDSVSLYVTEGANKSTLGIKYELLVFDGSVDKNNNNGYYPIKNILPPCHLARLILPKIIRWEVGKPLFIFKRSIINAYNYKDYNIQVLMNIDSEKGKDYDRFFSYTPSTEGEVSLTFNLYDSSHRLLDDKTVTLKSVNPKAPTSNENVLFIGDSLTFYNRITDEFVRILTSNDEQSVVKDTLSIYNVVKPEGKGFGNIDLIGTQVQNYKGWQGATKHEGYSGWSWGSFLGNDSPFVFNGSLNFNEYLISNGLNTPSVVYIGLGWNDNKDAVGYDIYYDVVNIKNNAELFLNELTSQLPNTKVRLWTEGITGVRGGIGNHPYGATEWADEHRLNLIQQAIAEMYVELAEKYHNVEVVWTIGMFDSEYCLQESIQPINGRIADTEVRGVDYIHPSDAGFFQLADGIIADFMHTY